MSIRRAGERGVDHDVNRQRGDVRGTDDAADRERRPQLVPARVELISEQGCRQRGVDEAGRDEVHADRCELEREGRHERRDRGGGRGGDAEAMADPPAAGATHEHERPAGPHLAAGVARDLESQHHVVAERLSHLIRVHLEQGPVTRASGSDQDVVDRIGQAVEELLRARLNRSRRRRPCSARRHRARPRFRRPGSRPVRTTSAPSARARRAVSRPMPALPPIRTTVCPASCGTRACSASRPR